MATITSRQVRSSFASEAPADVLAPTKRTFYLTGGVLAASIVLGGATRSGFLGDVILQFASVALIGSAINDLVTRRAVGALKWPLLFVFAIVAVPALQLVPLPQAIWSLLPGRDVIRESYKILGEPLPLLPLSMSPPSTWLSGLSIIPALAIFLGCLTLETRQRRDLSVLIVALGVFSVILGLLQLAQGPQSPLRFFAITNDSDAVGFFANRNHFAALLYMAMMFAAVWLGDATIKVGLQPRRKAMESTAILLFAASLLAFLSLIIAQLMARSRAGLGLSMVGLVAALALGLTDPRGNASTRTSAKIAIAATAVGIVFSLQFALYRILERFGPDPLADARIPFARNTITAAKAYMPFGSGLGTFVPIYQMFERPSDVMPAYANHAHDDLLELWLETGVLGIALLAIFFAWYGYKTYRIWRGSAFSHFSAIDRSFTKAATVALALVLAHSLVDYPLHTSALQAMAAVCCALMIRSPFAKPTHEEDNGVGRHSRVHGAHSGQAEAQVHAGDQVVGQPLTPRPRELWGESVEWPEAWRKPPRK